ncbi:MAG: Asp-tRNA(Asn)/Glu-tRNA(Gln) amidotransferase subunit GatA [Bacteroidetes bacterium]|nr:Asp-tRNA(Asn)/Glu-tRNA(Gln) amidotransferase subunit GatA [Bacteroidota bacterium]
MVQTYDRLRTALEQGTTTCEAITQNYLSTIYEKQHLNAFLAVYEDYALNTARSIDEKMKRGTAGPLAGMVVAVKDNICIKDRTVTCGSRMLEHFVSLYDATVIQKLKDADAIIIGKTNLDEFAMGSSSENSAFGRVKHPLKNEYVPGGSSGGSAVAVATGMSTTALGSDTGGSIRQPAAFCGVVGLKPTYGRVSRFGLVAYASSFDVIGPLGNCVIDVARVLQVIAGHDEKDSTSAYVPVPEYLIDIHKDITGLRVGLPKEYFDESLNSEIRSAIESAVNVLERNGVIVQEVSLPHTKYAIATYYILVTAEASSNLARYDGARYGYRSQNATDLYSLYVKSRSEGFGEEVKRRIMLGTYVLSAGYYDAYYRKGQKVRRLIRDEFQQVFQEIDCLLTPTSPTTAFKAGEKLKNPLEMYLSDIYTTSANLAGIPGISIPWGVDTNGMPIGVQLLAPQFGEPLLLRIAHFLESHRTM